MTPKETHPTKEIQAVTESVASVAKQRPHCIESLNPDEAVNALFLRACGTSHAKVTEATGLAKNTVRALEQRNAEALGLLKHRATIKAATLADKALEVVGLKLKQLHDDPEALKASSLKDASLSAAILTDKALLLSGQATEIHDHRAPFTFEEYQQTIRDARARLKAKAIDVEEVSSEGSEGDDG